MTKKEKMKKLATIAVVGLVSASTLGACSNTQQTALPDVPSGTDCDDWDFDSEEGVWQCDEETSSHYRSYYHGGMFHKTNSALHGSKSYQSYKSSSNFVGGGKVTTTSSSKSGFGGGSRGSFGG